MDTLFRTATLSCRLVGPEETAHLETAARFDIDAWGTRLGQGAERFRDRATNGFLVGAFQGDELVGTISAVRRAWAPMLEARGNPAHPYATWEGISSGGRFTVHEDGDALYCVAVTAKGTVRRPLPAVAPGDHPAVALAGALAREDDLRDEFVRVRAGALARATAEAWVPQDPVMRFHTKPKGGVLGGAVVEFLVPDGRWDDTDAMGYNVIMSYPEIAPGATFPDAIAEDPSPGETLILGAAALGTRLGVRRVIPYSRPGAFRASLIKALVAIGTGGQPPEGPFGEAVSRFVA
jgi:hypothetical protein